MLLIVILVLQNIWVRCDNDTDQMYYCHNDVCHNVKPINDADYDNYCWSIGNQTRLIVNDDYDNNFLKFSGRNVKMFTNKLYLIFFNCPYHENFTRVFQKNYTIFNSTLNEQKARFGQMMYSTPDIQFQSCLSNYCTILNNLFNCYSNLILNLNLKLTKILTVNCLESITYANLHSDNLTDINNSQFFNYAINIIKLVISASKNIKLIKCDRFRHLTLLKLLEIPYANRENALCILKFNSNLASISNSTNRIWNMCNNTYDFLDDLYVDNSGKFKIKKSLASSGNGSLKILFIFVPIALLLCVTLWIINSVVQNYYPIWRGSANMQIRDSFELDEMFSNDILV